MRRLLKLWLIVFIALALPFQGAAAASMLMCGPSHQGASLPSSASHDHSAHSHGAVHDDAATLDAGKQGAAEVDKLSKAKCSACSVCGAAVAIPGTVMNFESARAIDRFLPVAGSSLASFFSSGPERPPRVFLA